MKNRYFNGPNENQVLAEETNIVSSGAGDTHWALTDHEGSVRDVIDNSGSVLDHIQYDSFGNILSQSNEGQALHIAESSSASAGQPGGHVNFKTSFEIVATVMGANDVS